MQRATQLTLLHTSRLFTKPGLQELLISYTGGKITEREEALPGRMMVSTPRLDKKNQYVDAEELKRLCTIQRRLKGQINNSLE